MNHGQKRVIEGEEILTREQQGTRTLTTFILSLLVSPRSDQPKAPAGISRDDNEVGKGGRSECVGTFLENHASIILAPTPESELCVDWPYPGKKKREKPGGG